MTREEIHALSRAAVSDALAQLGMPLWMAHRPQLQRDLLLSLLLRYHVSVAWVDTEQRWHVLAQHPTAGIQAMVTGNEQEVPYLIARQALWMATQQEEVGHE